MAKDIIKQILIKFKGDTTELNKAVKDAEKVSTSLNKNLNLGPQYTAMDKFIKNISKSNENLSKTFTVFQKGMKSVLEGDMQKFEKRVEWQYKRIQRLQTELDRSTGTRADKIREVMSNAQGRMGRTMGSYNDIAKMLQDQGGAAGGGRGIFGSMLHGAANALGIPLTPAALGLIAGTAAVKAAEVFSRGGMDQLRTGAAYQAISDRYTQGAFGGDYSRSFFMANNPDSVLATRSAAGLGAGASTGRGMLLGLGRAIRALPSVLEEGEGSYLRKFRQLEETAAEESLSARERTNIKATKIIPYLTSRASSRLSFQRALMMGDKDLYANLLDASTSGLTENEFLPTALSMRNQIGSSRSAEIAKAAGRLRFREGTDLETGSRIMSVLSTAGNTSPSAEAKTVDMFSKAFSSGIKDSGLAEMIVRGNIESFAQAGIRGNAGIATALSASVLSQTGNPNDIMNVRAAGNLNQVMNNISGSSGLMNDISFTEINKFVSKVLPNATKNQRLAAVQRILNSKDRSAAMQNIESDPYFKDLGVIPGANVQGTQTMQNIIKSGYKALGPESLRYLPAGEYETVKAVLGGKDFNKTASDANIPDALKPNKVKVLNPAESSQAGILNWNPLNTEQVMNAEASKTKAEELIAQQQKAKELTSTAVAGSADAAINDLINALRRLGTVIQKTQGMAAE